ncbi:SDR family oxidoreductase [Leadbetterella byssophila]|uniref:Short-chain dehydrogenase/reductase SDR n=1 Tax=Leadbetterella byssophila (strain DSM 17132 / JCM 16389 / KACC 11308 / NBRC 106382 / 4M15) TaxID=649349 RepID=E4RU55_LEAB4|nr:SDR family oxidoreductase [Leadbetterella byssophila]ADQ16036.1 short-chain dehydrogenase/reductase SDR [Leadbetterella byssophila DSM 17132]
MNIVVTGASSGLGFETALELSKKGEHRVVAISRNTDKLKRLLEIGRSLNPDIQLIPVSFDLVNDDIKLLQDFIIRTLGSVDILINNAGQLINKPFMKTTSEEFLGLLQANVLSHFSISKALVPFMNKGAHILNIGSMGGYGGSVKFPGLSAYSASKGALHILTECMAVELQEYEIKVNCLALGSVQTEMLEEAFPGYTSPVMAFEMGEYVADFALNGSRFYNGKVLTVALTTP